MYAHSNAHATSAVSMCSQYEQLSLAAALGWVGHDQNGIQPKLCGMSC